MWENDLLERTFLFGVRTLKFLRNLPVSPEYQIIRYQLGKSCTSVGASYEEAQAGSSRADFRNKVRISLKEARESNYWLRVINAMNESAEDELLFLLKESLKLRNILASISNKLNTPVEDPKRFEK